MKKLTKEQIEKIRKELKNNSIPRNQFKDRPLGCPFNGNILPDLTRNFSREELHKAFILGLIGNANREGSVVNNCKW